MQRIVGKSHGGLNKALTEEERRGRLRGEGNKIKFIDLRFEGWQVVGFGKGRRRQGVPEIARSWDE